LAKLGPDRKQRRLWYSRGRTSLNTSESGIMVSISMPFDALMMTASFARNGANSFAVGRTVCDGATDRTTGASRTAASSEEVTRIDEASVNPGR
jgi:hypothetical protein